MPINRPISINRHDSLDLRIIRKAENVVDAIIVVLNKDLNLISLSKYNNRNIACVRISIGNLSVAIASVYDKYSDPNENS